VVKLGVVAMAFAGHGVGAVAVVGGTAVINAFVMLSAGSLVALQSFASLSQIGIQAINP
jgi:phospholipid/cholesterol/gamma-HCH transport system permease protein